MKSPGNCSLRIQAWNVTLGRLYGEIGDFSASRNAFDRALALEPNGSLTYLYLGDMLEKSGDLRGAAGAF